MQKDQALYRIKIISMENHDSSSVLQRVKIFLRRLLEVGVPQKI